MNPHDNQINSTTIRFIVSDGFESSEYVDTIEEARAIAPVMAAGDEFDGEGSIYAVGNGKSAKVETFGRSGVTRKHVEYCNYSAGQ
jgi:hypothetical protein